jgi:hypothetical protein
MTPILLISFRQKEKAEQAVKNATCKERLEILVPDSYTLDVILNNNSFAVSSL